MASQKGVDDRYWLRRSDMMYYKYIDILVKAFAYEAKNIIDIGSANTNFIEAFHWIPEKFTLDIKNPYSSPNVTAIETDFLIYNPKNKFDFATCFQVLEHIPDVKNFAKKLFMISDRVLVSVPYLWPENAEDEHVHDPVDREKLKEWTGREPSYSIIVSEPLRIPRKGISKRLICYYGVEGEQIDYKKVNENVKALQISKNEIKCQVEWEKLFSKVEQNNRMYEGIHNDLNKIIKDQKKYYELIKLELNVFNLQNDLDFKLSANKEEEDKLEILRKEISDYKSRIHNLSIDQQYYLKEYNKILQSTSWKLMAPMRLLGSLFKKITRKRA